MNIILIVIDTLHYDYIGIDGNDWIQTPNIDRLAKKSRVFERAYVASYPTFPHRTDVITGRYGGPFNPWMPLRSDVTTLPEVLANAGYCTQLIHDTPVLVNGGAAFDWPFHACTSIRGASTDRPWIDDKPFEFLDNWKLDPLFDSLGDREMKEIWGIQLVTYTRANRGRKQLEDWNTAKLFLRAADFLRDNVRRDNFFLWLDCFDPHEPWDAPAEFVRMYDKRYGYDGRIDPRVFDYVWQQNRKNEPLQLSRAAIDRLKAWYAAKVSFVDWSFGKFLDTLEKTGLDKNTAIIVTADHGTCLGEMCQRGYSHYGKRGFWEVGEPEGHVPMIVYVPGLAAGRSDLMVQPQDIFPTVLGIAEVERPDNLEGNDLFALGQQSSNSARKLALMGYAPHAWSNEPGKCFFTVFAEDWYLNCAAASDSCRLFRYGSTKNVAANYPSVVEELRERGIKEIARRGTNPKLINWLQSEGRERFPSECCTWPGPPNWKAYWDRLYNKW